MLESIGLLAIIVVVIYIIVQYNTGQEDDEYYRRKITTKSTNYRTLVYEYERSVKQGKPTMSELEFERKKKSIINSPQERFKIDREVEDERFNMRVAGEESKKTKAAHVQEHLDENSKKRIFGYKFDVLIFKIFNDRCELTKHELLAGINKSRTLTVLDKEGQQFYLNEMLLSDEEILNLWIENSLIKTCYWGKNKDEEYYTVGYILTDSDYKINDNDITWRIWAGARRITLKRCKAYYMYMERNNYEEEEQD
jgi:hypothetical protein